jgi:hypothetical protein
VGRRQSGVTIIAIVLTVSGVFQLLIGAEVLHNTSFGLAKVADVAGPTHVDTPRLTAARG